MNNTENNSLLLTSSRYVAGGVSEASDSKIEWWEKRVLPRDSSDKVYIMSRDFEGRPDLLSHTFYEDTSLWWVILQYNNILDPLTELVEGVVLAIPDKDRVLAMISNSQLGGVESTRFYKN